MWRLVVVLYSCLMLVHGILDWRYSNSQYRGPEFDCFDYPSEIPFRSYEPGWGLPKKMSKLQMNTPKYVPNPTPFLNVRRIDILLSNREDIVKEHAKLVQDINGLKQVVFVPPMADESRDYDDSIFHELIETSSTTSRPSTTKATKSKGIPIVLLGGASRKHTTKSHPAKVPRHTISLVGTSFTPLVRHPYPYVMAASTRQPVRICMSPPIPPIYPPTPARRLSMWERLLKSIIPR